MADEKASKRILVIALVWLTIVALVAVAYKLIIHPILQDKKQTETGSESQYKHDISIALDSFSGYCILRSPAFRKLLKQDGIKLTIVDDKADYLARSKALKKGEVQFAAFPLNTIIETGAEIDSFPGTIVMILDETKGADAILAKKGTVNSISDLNSKDARFCLIPDSPSEFLARIVVASFNLPDLPENYIEEANSMNAVYSRFQKAHASDKTAFVMWEPYVSKALSEGNGVILIDSSKLKGYIVDVLVVQRDFLLNNEPLAKQFLEAYLKAAFSYQSSKQGMLDLVISDAKEHGGETLTVQQAEKVTKGIEWKNTLENYLHFGLAKQTAGSGIQHLEDMINNIADVLTKTGALQGNPVEGKAHTLFYDKILAALKADNFHPAKKVNILDGAGLGSAELTKARTHKELTALSQSQWQKLIPVGTIKVNPISFGRGNARLNIQSKRDLDNLAKRLQSFPDYYLQVVGHTRAAGDLDANLKLAESRAAAAADYLMTQGISKHRINTYAAKPSEDKGSAQAVSFVVKELPY